MAPEQRRGAPEDERTDVFALGVVLFRMLANELPFADGAEAASGAQALELAEAPDLGPLVGRMLEVDPVARRRDAGEVLPGLELAAAEVARAVPVGTATIRIRRRPGGAAGAPTADVRAYEYCVRGRQFIRQTRKASLEFACDLFSRAIAVDPRHALAHAGLAEAAATASAMLPDHPYAFKWYRLGWRWLKRAFQVQISTDGSYTQHSTNYHRLMLQAALWAHAVHEHSFKNDPIPKDYLACLELCNTLAVEDGRSTNRECSQSGA